MIPQTFYRRFHICQIKSLVVRMLRITCQPKFLPDQQSHFVTQLEEIVGFSNTASPHTYQINAGLFGIA